MRSDFPELEEDAWRELELAHGMLERALEPDELVLSKDGLELCRAEKGDGHLVDYLETRFAQLLLDVSGVEIVVDAVAAAGRLMVEGLRGGASDEAACDLERVALVCVLEDEQAAGLEDVVDLGEEVLHALDVVEDADADSGVEGLAELCELIEVCVFAADVGEAELGHAFAGLVEQMLGPVGEQDGAAARSVFFGEAAEAGADLDTVAGEVGGKFSYSDTFDGILVVAAFCPEGLIVGVAVIANLMSAHQASNLLGESDYNRAGDSINWDKCERKGKAVKKRLPRSEAAGARGGT